MPGRPIIRAGMRKLDEVGEDDIFAAISGGMGTKKAIKHFNSNNRIFYKWLDSADGRRERYLNARKLWADTLAEECLDIANGTIDAHDATVRKLRIDTRKWLAQSANPDNWRERRDPLVNVTLGDQHLDALRAITGGNVIEHDDG